MALTKRNRHVVKNGVIQAQFSGPAIENLLMLRLIQLRKVIETEGTKWHYYTGAGDNRPVVMRSS